jgi:hypothetical protein
MNGKWTYNPDQSVNAATGRPETQRAANDRRSGGSGGAGGGPRVGAGGGGVAGPAGPPGGIGSDRGAGNDPGGGGFGPPSVALNMYQQARDTQRDLMEIAPALNIGVTDSTFTVTDDLGRTLTFQTDGKRKKYQLGAAVFDAKAYWDASQLRLDIEGPNGFKMKQSYLLSEDGTRLFMIIRLVDQSQNERTVGVNRAYDRAR